MTEDEQKRVFSKNLTHFIEQKGVTQRDVAQAIGVTPQSLNQWCMGTSLPRMGKIQKLASYFNVNTTSLIDDVDSGTQDYYFNEETAKAAQEMFENKDLRVLYDAARDASPEDLRAAYQVLMALKAKERGRNDEPC